MQGMPNSPSKGGRFTRFALVTGGNRGIGFEIVHRLSVAGFHVIIGSRDLEAGNSARVELISPQVPQAALSVIQLDQTSPESVAAAVATVRQLAPGGLDVLVCNAGFAFKMAATESLHEQAVVTIGVNYTGTRRVIEAFLPSLKERATAADTSRIPRIVVIGSRAGLLKNCSESRHAALSSVGLTVEAIDAAAAEFIAAAQEGPAALEKAGFPKTTYGFSKVLLHAYSRLLARQNTSLNVYVVCPGWCRTNMAGEHAPRSAAEGAETPAWIASLSPAPPTGTFWADNKMIEF